MAVDIIQLRRHANELMREGLRTGDPTEPNPFLCECGDAACDQVVWVTAREYEERRDEQPSLLVARSHDEAWDPAALHM